MRKLDSMVWPKLAFAVAVASSSALGLAQIFCDSKVLEYQISYGDKVESKLAVFKRKAFITRDSSIIDSISKTRWSSNGSWSKVKNYKFAIVSIPDTSGCKADLPDTTYFDSKCYVFGREEAAGELSPKFLLLISRLVSEEDKKKMFGSPGCRAKLKYALDEEAHPAIRD